MQRLIPVISTLGKLRQENCCESSWLAWIQVEFQNLLGHTVRLQREDEGERGEETSI